MSSRVLVRFLLASALLAGTCSCAQEKVDRTSTSAECSTLAAKAKIDERCAIEMAKAEILRRQGRQDYSRFMANYDSDRGTWLVTAFVEPLVPGGHLFVSIARNGDVSDYTVGR
jgi:hypothetical protein